MAFEGTVRQLVRGDDPRGAASLLMRFFREEGFSTPPEVIAAHCREMMNLDICAVLVAEQGGETIGVATVSLTYGIEFGWSAEVGDLYVRPEHRRLGVAAALFAAIEGFLTKREASGYQVTVTPYAQQHHSLKDYYLNLGFADEGREILYRKLG